MYITTAILCGVIVAQSVIHHIERQDLYDRIQSGTFADYQAGKSPPRARSPTRREILSRKWKGDDNS